MKNKTLLDSFYKYDCEESIETGSNIIGVLWKIHNQYLEDVEKYSRAGSIAEKVASFEAHYRRTIMQHLSRKKM